jgi:hypothetical protein
VIDKALREVPIDTASGSPTEWVYRANRK